MHVKQSLWHPMFLQSKTCDTMGLESGKRHDYSITYHKDSL